ncbi:MAG: hypothetical protein LKI24_05495 [Acidipropionibacterium sp.]|nr:hypothetical protein [Acidipropionibacterium sp.]
MFGAPDAVVIDSDEVYDRRNPVVVDGRRVLWFDRWTRTPDGWHSSSLNDKNRALFLAFCRKSGSGKVIATRAGVLDTFGDPFLPIVVGAVAFAALLVMGLEAAGWIAFAASCLMSFALYTALKLERGLVRGNLVWKVDRIPEVSRRTEDPAEKVRYAVLLGHDRPREEAIEVETRILRDLETVLSQECDAATDARATGFLAALPHARAGRRLQDLQPRVSRFCAEVMRPRREIVLEGWRVERSLGSGWQSDEERIEEESQVYDAVLESLHLDDGRGKGRGDQELRRPSHRRRSQHHRRQGTPPPRGAPSFTRRLM